MNERRACQLIGAGAKRALGDGAPSRARALTCMESAPTTSPTNFLASSMASLDFPVPVAPSTTTKGTRDHISSHTRTPAIEKQTSAAARCRGRGTANVRKARGANAACGAQWCSPRCRSGARLLPLQGAQTIVASEASSRLSARRFSPAPDEIMHDFFHRLNFLFIFFKRG